VSGERYLLQGVHIGRVIDRHLRHANSIGLSLTLHRFDNPLLLLGMRKFD
jgi:hypothetical protein